MNAWIENLPGFKLKSVVEKHGAALMERHHTDDVHFAIWLHTLNRAVQNRVIVSYDDLEDWDYWSAYEADMSPRDAAIEMLCENGWSEALPEEERV